MSSHFARRGTANAPRATSSTVCQKCLGTGTHRDYTLELSMIDSNVNFLVKNVDCDQGISSTSVRTRGPMSLGHQEQNSWKTRSIVRQETNLALNCQKNSRRGTNTNIRLKSCIYLALHPRSSKKPAPIAGTADAILAKKEKERAEQTGRSRRYDMLFRLVSILIRSSLLVQLCI